jgi:hypothetical protein
MVNLITNSGHFERTSKKAYEAKHAANDEQDR